MKRERERGVCICVYDVMLYAHAVLYCTML